MLEKKTSKTYLCRVYVPTFHFSLSLTSPPSPHPHPLPPLPHSLPLLLALTSPSSLMPSLTLSCRSKAYLQHNAHRSSDDDSDVFHDIEMTIDDEFDSESGEIEIGKFVSFRYAGEYTSGLPMNPRISLLF